MVFIKDWWSVGDTNAKVWWWWNTNYVCEVRSCWCHIGNLILDTSKSTRWKPQLGCADHRQICFWGIKSKPNNPSLAGAAFVHLRQCLKDCKSTALKHLSSFKVCMYLKKWNSFWLQFFCHTITCWTRVCYDHILSWWMDQTLHDHFWVQFFRKMFIIRNRQTIIIIIQLIFAQMTIKKLYNILNINYR